MEPVIVSDGSTAPNIVERSCEVCRCQHASPLPSYNTTHWPLVECSNCGFVYLRQVPSYSALAEDFPWEVTSIAEKQRRSKSRFNWLDRATRWRTYPGHVIDRYRRRHSLGVSGNVLDIGCGGACRVPDGPIPHGIEISAALAAGAQSSFATRGGRVVHANAIDGMDAFQDEFFSAILMRSYLEHEAQPKLILEKAWRKLAPNGKIFVRVPDYGSLNRRLMGRRWCGFRFPDHVNYFTLRSLRELASGSGFTCRRVNWLSPLDDNIIAVLVKHPNEVTAPNPALVANHYALNFINCAATSFGMCVV